MILEVCWHLQPSRCCLTLWTAGMIRECNPGTRAPENPGKPADFQTRKPGFV